MELKVDKDCDRKVVGNDYKEMYSPYCDFVYYNSSRNPEMKLAMKVLKPPKPSYILVTTHGWHLSINKFNYMDKPNLNIEYITLEVDMRGRAYSDGKPDCNGWELYDVIDAVRFAKKHYKDYILDENIVFFEGESGGGGNAYAIAGKFPDYFAAINVLCGISDYTLWYNDDKKGEFRDEMDQWIGCTPGYNPMAYNARSGISLIENLITPISVVHGQTDIRVPSEHARRYVARACELGKAGLVTYMELKGVGTLDHWGNATKEQIEGIRSFNRIFRRMNCKVVCIPHKGVLKVAGFLETKFFRIILDSIDKIAFLKYDIKNDSFEVTCSKYCKYNILTIYGKNYSGMAKLLL